MKIFIIKAIKWVLNYVGYYDNNHVVGSNFINIAQAYEYSINKDNDLLRYNETRLQLMGKLKGTPPSEAYFIVQALSKTNNILGDVCEFGVAQGETSALIANEILLANDKYLHLFDSFEGLPMPTDTDRLKDDIFSLGSIEAYKGKMSYPEFMVNSRLKEISFPVQRYVVHKGFITKPIVDDSIFPKAVSFAFVDFDFYEPIKIVLDYLDRVTSPGSIIIVDDYDFFSTGAKTAVDEFMNERNLNEVHYECYVPNKIYGCFAILTKI
jgi:O-methyltransferase